MKIGKNPDGLYRATDLPLPPTVSYGFSIKPMGDVRDAAVRARILSLAGFDAKRLVWMKQVHSADVATVGDDACGTTLYGVDAVVFAYGSGPSTRTPVLAVHTADCMPVLLVDPTARVIAAVHSGWKGTLGHIVTNTVRAMERAGAHTDDIRVIVGPAIGACCYSVPDERAARFSEAFPEAGVVERREGVPYLDLGRALTADLIAAGIKPAYVVREPALCTADMHDEFYSYRRETTEEFGECMGYIGFV